MTGIVHFFDTNRFQSFSGTSDGGSVFFYYTNTTTLAPIYTDINLTTPAANPILVPVGGILPSVYLDPAITYRRRIVYTSDGSVFDTDPCVAVPSEISTDLSDISGASLIGNIHTGTLADVRAYTTVGKNRSYIQSTLNQAGLGGVALVDGNIDLGSSAVNDQGANFIGSGLLYFNNSSVGARQVQNRPQTFPHYGREELFQFHRYAAINAPISVGMLGDSNTESYVGTALKAMLEEVAGITVVNYAVGGSDVYNYNQGTLGPGKTPADVKAAGHKCILFLYGGTNAPYQNRTIAQYEADLDTAIADLRTVYKIGQCSLVMFTGHGTIETVPQSTGEKRDMKWTLEARNVVLKIARKYGCAVFDKAALYCDSTVDRYPTTDGYQAFNDVAGFHTQTTFSNLIARDIFNFLLPDGIINDRLHYRSTLKLASALPSSYRVGRSSYVANASDGWPFDGIVFTDFIPGSTLPSQEIRQYGASYPLIAKRTAINAGTWSSWMYESLKLKGSIGYDPPSLAAGASATTTVTVTGAALGDIASASFSIDLQGINLEAWVSSANTVSVRFHNQTGGVLDIASGILKASVEK